MSDENDLEVNVTDLLKEVSGKIRITKVTATRSLRGVNGQTFSGFSARTDSIEDDSAMVWETSPEGGVGLKDARVAYYMLAMQADLAAINASWASGDIPNSVRSEMIRNTKRNFALLLRSSVKPVSGDTDE